MKKKILMLSMLVLAAVLLVVSCDNGTKEPSEYTVTFDSNGGTAVASQTVKKGEKATKPANPTHTGWGFLRWSLTDDGETAFDFENETVTGDITLHAVWKTSYIIGDRGPSGGWIFYDCDADNNLLVNDGLTSSKCGWRYLEAASADLAEEYVFGEYKVDDKSASLGTSGDIGKGKENTDDLTAAMGETVLCNGKYVTYAAKACADWGNGTDYDDWFLPSSGELQKMYQNLKANNLGGTWQDSEYSCYYWSSTDVNATPHLYAVTVKFYSGVTDNQLRYEAKNIRPARRF